MDAFPYVYVSPSSKHDAFNNLLSELFTNLTSHNNYKL